ncbi:MAG TPA: 3-oxoacyl-[acyl-carrier-protein] reductase [Bacteroidetes bacterium]|nr:3-oxoacyl-[acyl-carrier-protein] reductase [Bacteroidota bacterium]|tara:strand:- start:2315 stop:3034 length:720 start_codon:yes stop_codon:yes gene_type:complete
MNSPTKIILITGGSRGIGLAIAEFFLDQGHTVYATSRGLEDFQAVNPKIKPIASDASDYASCEETVKHIVAEEGRLDVLVNNAGITRDNLIMRMKEEDWDAVININLKSAYNLCKHAGYQMVRQKSGRIINISSIVGRMGQAGQANYAASKAGMIGLTKSLAAEFAARNVTVNAVAPGFIETKMTEVLPEDVRQKYMDSIPARRLGQPEEVASLISFLASDAAGYINGQVINVCGGLHR